MIRKLKVGFWTLFSFYRMYQLELPESPVQLDKWFSTNKAWFQFQNTDEAKLALRIFRHLSRLHNRNQLCLYSSLFLLMSWPHDGEIHFEVNRDANWTGHSWVTLDKEVFTADLNSPHQPIFTWIKKDAVL